MITKPVKILYIITSSDTGGAQKYVHDLVTTLDQNFFSSKIVYGDKDTKWLSNKTLPHFFFYNDLRAIFELALIYKRENPHIIHLNSSKAGVIGAFALILYKVTTKLNPKPYTSSSLKAHQSLNGLYPKLVFTAHGWVFNPSNKLFPPVRWFYILLHKLVGYATEHIITVSNFDYSLAKKYTIISEKKLTTIHNGIDIKNLLFLDKVTARKQLLSRITVKDEQSIFKGIWIGSIGRLTKEKDYKTLIEAAAYLPHLYFFILGEGELFLEYKERIAQKGLRDSFFIINQSTDAHQFLRAFDLFALSSVKEGLPYVLLEASAAQLPSVATNTGGISEIITDSVTGFVIPIQQSHLLASQIQKLAKDEKLRNNFGKAALAHIQKEFFLTTMTKNTERIYKKLLL